MYGCFVCMDICAPCVQDLVTEGRGARALGIGVTGWISRHVGAGNGTLVFCTT